MVVGLSPDEPASFAAGSAGWGSSSRWGPPGARDRPRTAGLFPSITPYAKALIGFVGLLLLPLLAGTVDRDLDAAIRAGKMKFDAIRTNRASSTRSSCSA
jgi:hypothetical protein